MVLMRCSMLEEFNGEIIDWRLLIHVKNHDSNHVFVIRNDELFFEYKDMNNERLQRMIHYNCYKVSGNKPITVTVIK